MTSPGVAGRREHFDFIRGSRQEGTVCFMSSSNQSMSILYSFNTKLDLSRPSYEMVGSTSPVQFAFILELYS